MRRYWKGVVGFILLPLSNLGWILDQVGRAQTVRDLPLLSWILSPYFSPIAFLGASILIARAYYEIRIKKEQAGFQAVPKNKSTYRIQAISGVTIFAALFIGLPLAYRYYRYLHQKQESGLSASENPEPPVQPPIAVPSSTSAQPQKAR
jgi:hypothetical protein